MPLVKSNINQELPLKQGACLLLNLFTERKKKKVNTIKEIVFYELKRKWLVTFNRIINYFQMSVLLRTDSLESTIYPC